MVTNITDEHAFYLKLARTNGAQIWLTEDFEPLNGGPLLTVNSADDIYFGSEVGLAFTNSHDIRLGKLDSSGAFAWVHPFGGPPSTTYRAFEVASLPADDPVLAGALDNHFALIRLRGTNGRCGGNGCLDTLDTGVIKVGEKFRKKWLWRHQGNRQSALSVPAPFTPDDPVTAGVTIELSNPIDRRIAPTVHLPEGGNWKRLGNKRDPGSRGYLYVDKTRQPRSVLVVQDGARENADPAV